MIDIKNLTMMYGATVALDNVSFSVKEKEIVGLLGPNGAGKTTLMRILTTFIYPTKGTAIIKGFDITENPLAVRRLLGYLPETPPLYADMRVDEYLDFVARSRGICGRELQRRKDWVVDAVKIAGVWKHAIFELSLGYRQRVGLAQALIHDPKVVILDEPTSGLDPIQIIGIRSLIKELAKEKTIIFSTHILQEASAISDRLVIIDRGEIIARGTLPELKKEKSGHQVFFVEVQASRNEVEAALKGIAVIKESVFEGEFHQSVRFAVTTTSYDEAARALNVVVKEKGWVLRELSLREPSLEEVFLSLFKRADQRNS